MLNKETLNRIVLARFVSAMGDWGGLLALTAQVYAIRSSALDISILLGSKGLGIFLGGFLSKKVEPYLRYQIGNKLALIDFIRAATLLSLVSEVFYS